MLELKAQRPGPEDSIIVTINCPMEVFEGHKYVKNETERHFEIMRINQKGEDVELVLKGNKFRGTNVYPA